MGIKKSSHMSKSWHLTQSALVKKFARARSFMHFKWDDGVTTGLLVAVGVAAAIMLSAALRPGKPADTVTADVRSKTVPAAATRASNASDARVSKPRPETSAAMATVHQSPVTLTGCLEQDDDAFRLKDTTGENAPKSRSWKSGFLKKKAASIEVVDAANKVKLPNHVGERVVITGMLVNREMQVRSLQRVAASCKQQA
jgi:hypothetical protein